MDQVVLWACLWEESSLLIDTENAGGTVPWAGGLNYRTRRSSKQSMWVHPFLSTLTVDML